MAWSDPLLVQKLRFVTAVQLNAWEQYMEKMYTFEATWVHGREWSEMLFIESEES
jgi:hypothetical protein